MKIKTDVAQKFISLQPSSSSATEGEKGLIAYPCFPELENAGINNKNEKEN